MSTEQILLIVALLAVPLIQSGLRAVRKRRGDKPGQAESLPSSARRPPMGELQPPPATEDRIVFHAKTTPDSKEVRNEGRPVAPPARWSSWRGTAAAGLHDPVELRRAVVFMTLLDPCRAIEPHESQLPAGAVRDAAYAIGKCTTAHRRLLCGRGCGDLARTPVLGDEGRI